MPLTFASSAMLTAMCYENHFITWCGNNYTWRSWVNSCLSRAVLSPLPGYSKSRSIPSKLYCRTKLIDEMMNCARFHTDASIRDICCVPAFAPPTDIRVFNAGFFVFRLLKRWYLEIIVTLSTRPRFSMLKTPTDEKLQAYSFGPFLVWKESRISGIHAKALNFNADRNFFIYFNGLSNLIIYVTMYYVDSCMQNASVKRSKVHTSFL